MLSRAQKVEQVAELTDKFGRATCVYVADYRGVAVDCPDAGDVDDDEVLTTADAVRLLDFLYGDGAPPEAPFPNRGWESEDEGPLGCQAGL